MNIRQRNKQIILLALLLTAGLTLAHDGCQSITQPNANSIPVTRRILVRDGNGNDFQGASVQLYLANASAAKTSPSTTGPDGSAVFSSTVPPGLEWYVCIVSATAEYPPIQDSVQLGCNDTTLEFILSKQITIPCAVITDTDSAKCHVCIGPGATDSAYTPWLKFSCPNPLAATATTAGATGLMRVTYSTKSPASGPSATPPATLAPNEQIQAKVVYSPTVPSAPADKFALTLGFGPSISYTFNVVGTAENCTNCDCPASDFVASLPKPDTVCINTSQDTAIDLSSVHNPGDPATCSWLFTLQSDFPDNQEIALSRRSFSLAGGSSLGALPITFSPQQNKVYDETATFSITTQPKSGNGMACSEVLKVHFVGYASGPNCVVDPASPILHIDGKGNNFTTCVDQADTASLIINNTGACDATNVNVAVTGTGWSVSPTGPVTIPARSSRSFTVTFDPTSSLVYGPNGNECGPSTNQFPGSMTVTSCAGQSPYALNALANPCHQSLDVTSPDTAISPQGFWVEDNNVIANAVGDTNWTMFVTNVDPVNKTASLDAWSPKPNLYRAFFKLETNILGGVNLCPPGGLGCNYITDCGSEKLTQLTIHEGDVILFSYFRNGGTSGQTETHCGIIYVTNIGKPDQGGHAAVTFTFCYPLFTTQ